MYAIITHCKMFNMIYYEIHGGSVSGKQKIKQGSSAIYRALLFCRFLGMLLRRYHHGLLFIRGEESACSNLYK